jgi:phosphatidylserine synthase
MESVPIHGDSPPQKVRKNPLRLAARGLGIVMALIGIPSAFNLWLIALGRFYLFVFDCHLQLGMNHSDDYTWVYSSAWWLIPMGLLSTVLLWQPGKKWRNIALWVFLANLLAIFAFMLMHWTRILVSYDEYIQSGA